MVTIISMVTFRYSHIHDSTFQTQIKSTKYTTHSKSISQYTSPNLPPSPPPLPLPSPSSSFKKKSNRRKCEYHITHRNTIQLTILRFNSLLPVSHQSLRLQLPIHKDDNNCYNIPLGHPKCTMHDQYGD